jgi:hypothetical protein
MFTILTGVVLLLGYKDATPPTKTSTYSHTTNVSVKEIIYLKNYPLILINHFYPPSRPRLSISGKLVE